MNIQQILDVYKGQYPVLHDVYIKYINTSREYVGSCETELYGDFIFLGKMRLKKVKPLFITLCNGDNDMIFTLLHEITHAITMYCERKVKDMWICMDHTNKFYDNFLDIMNIAYDNGIVNRKYDMKSLRLRDMQKSRHKKHHI